MTDRVPDALGHYGRFGGRFVPEVLMAPLEALEQAYREAKADPAFQEEFAWHLREYAGRPTLLYRCDRLSDHLGGARIYLKREDLCHTGSHKINNVLGQALLARRMGKRRLIAETGAGQHGVATATAAALFGLECDIYMGEEDTIRQALNVFRMQLLGARVLPVTSGSRTLKDAINEGFRDWATNVGTTYYVMGTVAGAHPYPVMVRDFQAVIGREAREQILEREGRLPDVVTACVGGGSNAMGIFSAFLDDPVRLVGVEAAGRGLHTGQHAASIGAGRPGVIHGAATMLLQDEHGQIMETHSVSAGLDYPGVGPEHSWLAEHKRAEYVGVTDAQALEAFQVLSRLEGVIPALESAHAVAYAMALAPTLGRDRIILVNLSGRGDKDVQQVQQILEGRR